MSGGASTASAEIAGASGGASGGLSKMEYGDNSTDTNKLNAIIAANPTLFELPADAIDNNALNCSVSAPVNFLYLSTIRGGRRMSGDNGMSGEGMSGGGCGCGMSGGGCRCGMKGNRCICGGEVMNGGNVMNGGGCGCGMKGGSASSKEYTGGCFTCKKGVKNITLIYSGIHIIIPKLYSKYRAAKTAKAASVAKKAKAIKKGKYPKTI